MNPFYRLIVFLGSIFLISPLARGQANTPTIDQGTNPYSSFHGGDLDSVSLANGSLLLHIPLISYPQRGNLKLGFSVVYDNLSMNSMSQPAGNHTDTIYYVKGIGPHIIADLPWANAIPIQVSNSYAYEAMTPDGSSHPMTSTSDGLLSMDATGFNLDSTTGTLIDTDGVRYTNSITGGFGPPAGAEDPNGNKITNNGSSFTDSLGRVIPTPPMWNAIPGGSTQISASSCPSGPVSPSAAYSWTPPGVNGGTVPFTICFANVPVTYDPCGEAQYCYGEENAPTQMIQSIVLPNGTAWTFQYNTFGALSEIILPTGGTIQYLWGYSHSTSGGSCTGAPVTCPVTVGSRSVTDNTGTHTWTYSGDDYQVPDPTVVVTVMDPNQNQTVHTFSNLGGGGASRSLYETLTQIYQNISGTQTLLKTATTAFSWTQGSFAQSAIGVNVVPTTVTTTWPNGQVSQVQKTYDSGVSGYILGQVIEELDYDYGNGAPGALLRQTNTTYLAPGNSTYLANNLLMLPSSVVTYNGAGTQVASTTYGYDGSPLVSSGVTTQHDSAPPDGSNRGNLTSVTRWLNSPSGNLVSTKTYYDTGELSTSTTPKGNTTTFTYTCAGAYMQTVKNPLGQVTTYNPDCNTSLVLSVTDPNNLTTTYTYDAMWRLATASYPDGGLDTITHQETTPPFTATLTRTITSSQNYIKTNFFDGLGRLYQIQLHDPPKDDFTVTTYDPLGRAGTVYNPTRCSPPTTNCGESTWGFTAYAYDALNRKTLVTMQDGSTVQTAYCGATTLVTDEAGHWRRSTADGLGRLIEVDEPNSTTATVNSNGCPASGDPIWATTYGYDALDNLLSVNQGGSRSRSFAYDSLSRLASATNPEVGPIAGPPCSIAYAYDADGNLSTKTAPAPNQTNCSTTVTTTYGYENLDRLTGKTYSNGDPPVTYTYDQTACLGLAACANIGHRTSMTDAAGSESWAYDVVHRQSTDQRTTNSISNTTSYSYNYDHSLAALTYPSSRTITYTTDSAGRPSDAQDLANSVNYVVGPCANGTSTNGACYAPHGAMAQMQYGANVVSTMIYDNRLQPCWIYATTGAPLATGTLCTTSDSSPGNILDLQYNFNLGTADNGNVMGITNNRDTTRTQAYSYDQVNRISTGGTTSSCGSNCWGLTFNIDQWGNLATATATGSATGLNLTVNAYNHITTAPFAYDAAGNLTADAVSTYVWNAEGQLKTGGGVTYTYDGDGKRVMKSNGKLYWYGINGEVLAESTASGSFTDEYVFFGGQRVARRDSAGNVVYYVSDHLGTSRVVTNASGTNLDDSDFYPFGGEKVFTSSSGNTYKFTGKERDTETGNDYFHARFNSSTIGRFMSADPFTVTPGRVVDPQQLNLYTYARNNPLKHVDPTGMLIDAAGCMADKRCAKDWQKVQNIANQQDKNGNFIHPELHKILTALQEDARTFVLENSKLSPGTAGQFTITDFTANGKDFTRATLQLDFKQIKGISNVTGADLVPGFNKYQGLLDAPMYRLAETFGHEGAHGLFSIQNPAEAVAIQQILNDRDASMQGYKYPYPPDVMQKVDAANKALIPAEKFAQQEEKIINGELQADKKKQ